MSWIDPKVANTLSGQKGARGADLDIEQRGDGRHAGGCAGLVGCLERIQHLHGRIARPQQRHGLGVVLVFSEASQDPRSGTLRTRAMI